jgi:tripartite-type tricarboxylate transporter receptor subunit TctC
MIRIGKATIPLVLNCLVAAGLATASAAADGVSYQGRTISVIINSTAGGGTDITARMVGGLMTKYLPGQPQVVFRNMPGGGGVTAGNHFSSRVPADGLTILAGSR